MHLAAGQEPVAVGVAAHLRPTDAVTATHRPHHIALAHGMDMKTLAAEIFGKETGLGHGKGGHMHLFDPATNFGCSGIIAEGMPTAVGHALAFKKQGKDNVAVSFFGEGAANQGAFHESLNLAALWALPVVFVCEDNAWAISVPKDKATRHRQQHATGRPPTASRACSIPDNDPVAVYEAAGEAVGRARRGGGPSLIEVKTDRLFGHFEGDPQVYRTKEEMALLQERDARPGVRATADRHRRPDRDGRRRRPGTGRGPRSTRRSSSPARARIRSRRPRSSTSSREPRGGRPMAVETKRLLTTSKAIAEGIAQEMERDPSVFVMGEDIGTYGGIFGATEGLLAKFGPERVMDTPISETAFIGAAVGAAISGMRPIAELMFVDFFGVCMDQIYNHMAKIHYESGGNLKVPVVITTAIGGGYGDGAQHSQTLYGMFAHLPGMKIVVPSTPYDAKGLMISAIRDDNPVIYMFHKGIMGLGWMTPNPRATGRRPRGAVRRSRSARRT